MPMDKKYLGVFMLLSTQTGWVEDLLPADGTEPTDYKKTRLSECGVDPDFQKDFYKVFGTMTKPPDYDLLKRLVDLAASDTTRDVHRGLFDILSQALSNAPVRYSPPPCPKKETLQYIIKAVNEAPVPKDGKNLAGRK